MIVVDTGIFISAADASEPSHDLCAELLRSNNELVVPAPVVPEAAWLIEDRLGPQAEARFLRFVTSGYVMLEALTTADYERCIGLILQYEDRRSYLLVFQTDCDKDWLACPKASTCCRLLKGWCRI